MIKERDYLWDNIKALLICLVVTGHCIEVSAVHHSLTRAVNYWIYSFHMPAFIFVSGFWAMIYCNNCSVRAELLAVLICYYTAFQILFSVLKLIFNIKTSSISFFSPARGLWYLLAMIFFYLLVPLAERLPSYIVLPALITLGVLIGKDRSPSNYLALLRIFNFAPYFFMGYYLSTDTVNKLRSLKGRLRYPLGAALVVLSSAIWIVQRNTFSREIFFGKLTYHKIHLGLLEGAGLRLQTYLIAAIMIAALLLVMPSKKTIFSFVGKNSLQIFILHMALVIILFDSKLVHTEINSNPEFAVAVFAGAALTIILALPVFTYPFRAISRFSEKLCKLKK